MRAQRGNPQLYRSINHAKAQPFVNRSQSASGLIRQPQAKLKAQTKVGSERKPGVFFWLLFF